MAAELVTVKIQAHNGSYTITETDPPGWLDMFKKFAASSPLFLGVEIGQNLQDGILFQFEIDE